MDMPKLRKCFENPGKEYRGVPFWAWNCRIEKKELDAQIAMMDKMGFGGYHIHVRTGMGTPYLSDEFLGLVRYSIEEGKKRGLSAWLYDEDRWPSGSAGGKVTKIKSNRAAYLLFTPYAYGRQPAKKRDRRNVQGRGGKREENGVLLRTYDVCLDPEGYLMCYKEHREGETVRGRLWYVYLERAEPNPWFNNETYVDTLNSEAIQCFAHITYDRYAEGLSEYFGKELKTIFTDEPQHVFMGNLGNSLGDRDVTIPWTKSLEESFTEKYGYSVLERLPELFWELPGEAFSPVRYAFHNHVADLFRFSYCRTLGRWCREHGIMLTGHLMQEPLLSTQTLCIGDAMRCYPEFGLPGIDILADRHEYTTAKQAQSVVRQTGASGMLSELYGVTGWDYDFRGHKLQGDWQAALGVTVRVPHLTWMSMKGEAKRDYPACIGYQSPWWEKYGIIEDYFARLRVVLTQGKPIVRIAVLHPIESFWLHWGPADKTDHVRRTLDERFTHLTELLLFHLLDFDFVSEALIPELENDTGGIGEMKYQLLLIPACETLRSTTLDWLERFCGKGGKIVFIGACPKLIDGCGPETEGLRKTESGQEKARNPTVWKKLERIYAGSSRIPFDDQAILQICQEERLVDVRSESGKRPEHFLYQLRQDRDCLWLFLARGKNPSSPDVEEEEKQTGMSDTYEERRITVILKGEYQAERFDALTGQTEEAGVWHDNGKTYVEYPVSMHDSFLLRLQPAVNMKLLSGEENFKEEKGSETGWEKDITRYFEKVNVFLEEPNACVLDLAEYALDDEAYSPMEEILRLDNICRRRAGIPERGRDVLQPYLVEKKPALHRVRLRFIVYSEIYLQGIRLAMEDVRLADIRLNGAAVKKQVDGWYVDRCIETVLLPAFEAGKNVLEISAPLGEQENLEWCYLTGDFGVKVEGTKKTLTAPVRNLTFGDIVTQGLPFYTGNLRYEFDYDAQGDFCIHVPQYRGALVSVEVDGKKQGEIIFSPYICQVKGLGSGRHRVALTLYNTRQNGFGQLHHTPISFYQNPNSWRTAKDRWCYEYQFRRVGILTSPELYPDRD